LRIHFWGLYSVPLIKIPGVSNVETSLGTEPLFSGHKITLKKPKIEVPYNPVIPLLEIYPEEMKTLV